MPQFDDSVLKQLNSESKHFENDIDKMYRRSNGCYYTDFELASVMIDEMFNSFTPQDLNELENKTFLEPCVGSGNFVFAYLKKIYDLNYSKNKIKDIINNIYVADVNINSLNYYKNKLKQIAEIYFDISLNNEYFETHTANGLLFNLNEEKPQLITTKDVFHVSRFDIIVTNPPYKNLKAERDQFDSENEYYKTKSIYKEISNLAKKHLKFSTQGVLNLYKLFVEEILVNYTKYGSYISLLVPNTILSDKSCESIRTYMLNSNKLISVNTIPEINPYIDAQQGLCTLLMKKGEINDKIRITKDFLNYPKSYVDMDIDDVLNIKTGNAIIAMDLMEYQILKKIRKFSTVSDYPFIHNLRGELDLTADKSFINKNGIGLPLIRGRTLKDLCISPDSVNTSEYIDESFLTKTAKRDYIWKSRIACQQVVNLNKSKRLVFTLVRPGCILANSCNFISIDENELGIDLYSLMGLMNSKLINWVFNLTSSNNHVNNYEIDSLPIPVDKKGLAKLSEFVKNNINGCNLTSDDEIDMLVSQLYGIDQISEVGEDIVNEDEIEHRYYIDIGKIIKISDVECCRIMKGDYSIDTHLSVYETPISQFDNRVAKEITKKFKSILNHEVLNHLDFKLSDLDLEMICNIPPGGNWKNIPEETVLKSKRLQQIKRSGGRTTLYGRLDYHSPSYTISTYFNRPGNGTFVHPVYNRVISPREAARLQSFPDDYYFVGTKGSLLKQIGNAVPPLLAYSIGKKILEKIGPIKSVDLFCGAGGMTYGFKQAGIKSIVANDIEMDACTTIKVNNPEIPVICGDITADEIKDSIVELGTKYCADLVCGGPPCQGFSLAGKRFIDDPRNQLFKEFVDVVSKINPKLFVMENVEGLLSFSQGEIYSQIINLFSNLGYDVVGRVLNAVEYGVPQKRKRVIVIGVRTDLGISPTVLYPNKIRPEKQVSCKSAIKDLENVSCGNHAQYDPYSNTSEYEDMLMHKIPYGSIYDEYEIVTGSVQTKLF